MTAKKERRRKRAQEREAAKPRVPIAPGERDQVVADLMAKRQASEKLQPMLDERAAARAKARAEEDETPIETETGTITRYVPWSYPHGFVVIEMPSKQIEAPEPGKPPFETFEEADTHASQLNTWLSRRPTPGARYQRYILPPEPTEAGIIEMLDRLSEIGEHPTVVAVNRTMEVAISAALEVADRADIEAAAKRAAAGDVRYEWDGEAGTWRELPDGDDEPPVSEDTLEIAVEPST